MNLWEVMDDLVVTAKHLLDELNVSNDACSRTDHLFQAESRQALHDILDEYINNDGEDADSTYRTKLQQLIDNVLSFDLTLRIDDRHPIPPTACNIASAGGGGQTMTDGYIVVEEDEDSGDSNKTLESSVLLHEIYGGKVFNETDNLIDDAPSLSNATQGTPSKKKRRRPGSRQPKFTPKPKVIQ